MDIRIVKANMGHALSLKGRFRDADEREVRAMSGRCALAAALDGVRRSALVWAGLVDGRCVCVFGVASSPYAGVGVPWLLGSKELDFLSLALARRSRKYVHRMRERFPALWNMVHAEHTASLRWLRWCGFSVGGPITAGIRNELFHPFEMRRGHV